VEIGIVGAGGIGSYYAGQLSRAGYSVRLLARGDHLAAINARGLEVRLPEETYVATLEATDDGARLMGCDYIVVSVKSYSLPEIGPPVVAAARSGAAVVPLLNGVDVAERLQALGMPREQVIGGLVAVSVVRSAPGVVERKSQFDRMVLGELDRVPRERTSKLVSAFSKAGSDARESSDITLDLWRKFAFIVPMGVGCGMMREAAGGVLASERGRKLMADSLHEIIALGRAAGVALTDVDEEKIRNDLYALSPGIRPSFQLDLERGGPNELDLLAGAVSKLGKQYGVPTPVNDEATETFRNYS
jgi:2-dehydropantoate 2-reductase